MKVLRILILLALVIGGLTGCAATHRSEADSDAVSTIPWNRPATWEGRGALGGMMMMDGR